MVSLFAGYLTNKQHLNWSSNCRSLATCCTIYEQRQNQKPRPLLLFFACFVNTEGTAIAKMQMAENMHSILFSPSAACYEYFQKLNIFGIDNWECKYIVRLLYLVTQLNNSKMKLLFNQHWCRFFLEKVPKVTLHKTISRMGLECYEYFIDLAPFCEWKPRVQKTFSLAISLGHLTTQLNSLKTKLRFNQHWCRFFFLKALGYTIGILRRMEIEELFQTSKRL